MPNDNKPLMDILKELREHLAKDYSLNVDPRSYKGENAADSSLPADWQAKLEPISGGDGGGREGDKGAEKKATKAGSQGTDAYLHKEGEMYEESGQSPMREVPQEGQEIDKAEYMADEGEEGEMMDEGEGMEEGEGMDEGFEDKMGDEGHDEVVTLLRDIKAVLEHNSMAKQSLSAVKDMEVVLAGLTKSIPEIVDSRVTAGLKDGLKQYAGLNGSGGVGDIPRRIKTPTAPKNNGTSVRINKSEEVAPRAPVIQSQEDPARAIGVEGESLMKAADRITDHDAFVDGVEQLAGLTQIDDLRGAFKVINKMREQSGESLTTNLYYYKR